MAESDRKPEKIDLADILGTDPDPEPDPDDVVVLDPATGEPASGIGPAAASSEALRSAEAEKEKYFDLWVRARADFENLSKRVERERGEESARVGAALVKELLPVADNLERALSGVREGDPLREGVALVHRQLVDCLARAGLEPIEALGSVFNPVFHDAVVSEPTDRIEPNRVIEEMQRGYTFRGRVLRPSLVKVSVAPPGARSTGGAEGTTEAGDRAGREDETPPAGEDGAGGIET